MRALRTVLIMLCLAFGLSTVHGQGTDLAAVLEVLEGTVEVNRVNTEQWIEVRVEAIVGVGDRVRTNEMGRVRITFFADGIDTELMPSSEIRIEQFSGNADTFDLTLAVVVGQTTQRIGRALNASSSYVIDTPAMSLAARGTQFQIRVEDSGRAAMLVSEGVVDASGEGQSAEVPPSFGIRAAVNESLSDVIVANSFEALDAALDGCVVTVITPDDTSLNVRIAPSVDAPRIGVISAIDIEKFIGVTETTDWYRIEFRGGYAWVLSSGATIQMPCAGLRIFPDSHGAEDATLFSELGDIIQLEEVTAEATSEPTAEATPGS